jgi:hypothetical protein
MLRQSAMAGFAVNRRMFARVLGLQDITMAIRACGLTGVSHRTRRDLSQGIPAEMPILTEALWDQRGPQEKEDSYPGQEYACQAQKVFSIFPLGHVTTTVNWSQCRKQGPYD